MHRGLRWLRWPGPVRHNRDYRYIECDCSYKIYLLLAEERISFSNKKKLKMESNARKGIRAEVQKQKVLELYLAGC